MDGYRVSKPEIKPLLAFIYYFFIKITDKYFLRRCRPDGSHIAVVNSFFIIISRLHHFITREKFHPIRNLFPVNHFLQRFIQMVHAAHSAVHGGKHLQQHFILFIPVIKFSA